MKRIAVMQDISCLGKCSMSVILPVISAMGAECAMVPTAALSTHTAFPGPAVVDLSDFARRVMEHWKTLDPVFDGILTGYLADPGQAELALELMEGFAGTDTKIITDPAMADHGKLYSGLSGEMIPVMLQLCRRADLCLPNLTEGALMAGLPWREGGDIGYCREVAGELVNLGCKAVMLTGAETAPGHVGYYYYDGAQEHTGGVERLARSCHGTGDLFAGVVAGGVTLGLTAWQAGDLASQLCRRAMESTPADSRWGVAFEPHLAWLAGQARVCPRGLPEKAPG